jgi:DHA2 family multidrug resistance protein
MVQALQVSNTQKAHAGIADSLNNGNGPLMGSSYAQNPLGLEALNNEVNRQASMIAYVDNFWLMLILCLLSMPLLLLIAAPKKKLSQEEMEHDQLAAME